MNRRLATLGVMMTAMLAMPASADQGVQFDSAGFLKSFDAFAEEQMRLLDNAGRKTSPLGPTLELTVDLSRDSQARSGADFLYLTELPDSARPSSEIDPSQATSIPAFSFTPRAGAASSGELDRILNPQGTVRQTRTFTPRQASGRVALSYRPDGDMTAARKTLEVALSSRLSIEQVDNFSVATTPTGLSPFEQRSFDVGLDVDYWGFHLGAGLTQAEAAFDGDFRGYDVGLGYSWSNWSTQLSYSEMTQTGSFLALTELDKDFFRLDLGAAYQIGQALRLSGGVRFYDYGPAVSEFDTDAQRAGVFYLGTRLSF